MYESLRATNFETSYYKIKKDTLNKIKQNLLITKKNILKKNFDYRGPNTTWYFV